VRILLPSLFVDQMRQAPIASYFTGTIWIFSAAALVLLYFRKRTSLAVWLMVTLFATLPDLTMSTILTTVRFTLGWYTARSYALIAGCTVLIVLLTETIWLYARLARTTVLLRRERANRLMSLDAATGAIAHEIAATGRNNAKHLFSLAVSQKSRPTLRKSMPA
jgi:hypothetical protein